jgi:Tol biopolymer transport system component
MIFFKVRRICPYLFSCLVVLASCGPDNPGSSPDKLVVTTESLPSGVTGVSYEASILAAGGTAPYLWSVISGSLPQGLLLTEPGTPDTEITGTPTVAGDFLFAVEVADADGQTAVVVLSLKITEPISPTPPEILPVELPEGEVEFGYSAEITAQNGTLPYSWQIISGAPPGLTLSGSGNPATLSGTPLTKGVYSVLVEVSDTSGLTDQETFSLVVFPPLLPMEITTTVIPAGLRNSTYSATIWTVNGSEEGHQWTVVSGSLPQGVALDLTGSPDTTLSGTPQEAGTFAFTLRAEDSRSFVDEVSLVLVIEPEYSPLEILGVGSPLVLPDASMRSSYSADIAAQGGVPPYEWSLPAGSIPPGITVQSTATPSTHFSGIPTAPGTFDATIMVTDSIGLTSATSIQLTVLGPAIPVSLSTVDLPDGEECLIYGTQIWAENGTGMGQTWSVTAGALPPGFTLNATSSPSTLLYGVPDRSLSGVYSFSVTVTDSFGESASRPYTLTIANSNESYPLVLIGDATFDNRNDIYLADICTDGSDLLQLSPAGTTGDVDTSAADYAVAANGSKVAFIGDFNVVGMDEAWVVDLAAGPPYTPVNITPVGWQPLGDVFTIKISADGNRVAFNGDGAVDNVNEMWVADTSSPLTPNNAEPINQPFPTYTDVDTGDFWFSPDGKKIVFTADTNSSSSYEHWIADLTVVFAHSAARVNSALPSTSADVNDPPVWTPDSESLIFNADMSVLNRDELWLVDVSNPASPGPPVQLSEPQGAGDVNVGSSDYGISDDGQLVWYISDARAVGFDELYVVNIANPGVATLVHQPLASSSNDAFDAMMEPGGSRILVMGDMVTSSKNDLFVFDLTGPFPQPLLPITTGMQANGDVPTGPGTDWAWSPDGDWIAFIADFHVDAQESLVVVDASGLTPGPPTVVTPYITDTALDVYSLRWSPLSTGLAFYGDLSVSSRSDLYYLPILGPGRLGVVQNMTPNLISNGDVYNDFIFSPEGDSLFFRADYEIDNDIYVWRVGVNDTAGVPIRIGRAMPPNGDMFGFRAAW